MLCEQRKRVQDKPEKPLAQVQLPGLPVVPTTPVAVQAIAAKTEDKVNSHYP